MREVTQYRPLAEWLYNRSLTFYNNFPWVKELAPNQRAVHKVSQQINVDCHNGYLSGIIQKMGQAEPFRLQQKRYHHVSNDIRADSENYTSDIPTGVILRRLSTASLNRDEHRPMGKLTNEVRGTLFLKGENEKLLNICVGTIVSYDFQHPWFWEVPTVDQILKVFTFCKQGSLDTMEALWKN